MAEILTQVFQPESVRDQRRFCLYDDQVFIENERVMTMRDLGASPFPLSWLLLGHGDLELARGVGTLDWVPRHLDREVAQRRFRVPVLDDRAGGFNGYSFGSAGELERDVSLEVLAALNTDRDFLRLSLVEGGRHPRHAQLERLFGLSVGGLLLGRVGDSRSPRRALIAPGERDDRQSE